MKKILFVCNQNKYRSRTAEEIFKNNKNCIVKSAGLFEGCRIMLNKDMIKWADIIFVMEKRQKEEIEKRFPEEFISKFIISLNIPDIYNYMDPDLIKLLKERVLGYF